MDSTPPGSRTLASLRVVRAGSRHFSKCESPAFFAGCTELKKSISLPDEEWNQFEIIIPNLEALAQNKLESGLASAAFPSGVRARQFAETL
jgi:hypothetical protein